jgi:nucleoside-triphosphatase THEP1
MSKSALIKKQEEAIKEAGLKHFSMITPRVREPDVGLGYRLPRDLHVRVKVHCASRRITFQDFLIAAIREAME